MTPAGKTARPRSAPPDHAGSVLCRLLIHHPEVLDIRILGQTDMSGGIISYSLGVILPGGRELYVDVEEASLAG